MNLFSAPQAVEFNQRIINRRLHDGQPPDLIIVANGLLLQALNRQLKTDCDYRVLSGCHPLSLFVVQGGEGSPSIDPLRVNHGSFALDTTSNNTQNLWWASRGEVWKKWRSAQMHPSELLRRLATIGQSSSAQPKDSTELSMAYLLHSEFVKFCGLGSCFPLPASNLRPSSTSEGFVVCQHKLRRDNQGRASLAIFAAIQSVLRELIMPMSQLRRQVVFQMTTNPDYINAIEDALGIPAFHSSIRLC